MISSFIAYFVFKRLRRLFFPSSEEKKYAQWKKEKIRTAADMHIDRDEALPSLLEQYVRKFHPRGHLDDIIRYAGGKHHWNYLVPCGGKKYIARVRNPNETMKWKELTLEKETFVLKQLSLAGLAPEPCYYDDERFFVPLLFLEYIEDGLLLNEMKKPLPAPVLRAAGRAIARLNKMPLFPYEFPLRQRIAAGGVRDSFTKRIFLWYCRLARVEMLHGGRKDAMEWIQRLRRIVQRVAPIFEQYDSLLIGKSLVLQFNGAHAGNMFWRKEKKQICFFDLADYVSFSGNTAFTAGRFLTSLYPDGSVPCGEKEEFAGSYLSEWNVPDFLSLLGGTILERSVADLLYVFCGHVSAGEPKPIEENKNFVERYSVVRGLLSAVCKKSRLV